MHGNTQHEHVWRLPYLPLARIPFRLSLDLRESTNSHHYQVNGDMFLSTISIHLICTVSFLWCIDLPAWQIWSRYDFCWLRGALKTSQLIFECGSDWVTGVFTDTQPATTLSDFFTSHTHARLTALFRDYLGGPVPERLNQSGFYWSKRQWVVVASAGPYASLHLAPDR